jgi:hypothetical protein
VTGVFVGGGVGVLFAAGEPSRQGGGGRDDGDDDDAVSWPAAAPF